MKLYVIAIAWYVIGMLVFYTCGVAEISYWRDAYFLWEKTKDLLLFSVIAAKPYQAPGIKGVYFFAAIRLVWEILYNATEWSINDKKAVGILFIILTVTITCVLCKELFKWEKQKLRRSS